MLDSLRYPLIDEIGYAYDCFIAPLTAVVGGLSLCRQHSCIVIELGSDALLRRVGAVIILTGAFANDEHLQMIYLHHSEMKIIFI